MTRHIDPEALSRFREGDLSPRKATRFRAHLGGCARCADLSSQLDGVSTLLASTRVPPMPEHLAARISTALATESAQRVAATAGTEPGRRDLPARGAGPRRQRTLPRLMPPAALRTLAAAGALAVIAGSGYAISHLHSSSNSASSSASGEVARPGLSRKPGAAPANGAERGLVNFGPSLRYSSHGQASSFVPVSTAGNYMPGKLAAEVSATLTSVRHSRPGLAPNVTAGAPGEAGAPGGTSAQPAPQPARPQSASAASGQFEGIRLGVLQACVTRVAAGRAVVLVDVASYLGSPATVIVVGPSASVAVQVLVVGPACSAASSDLLVQRDLPRG
jgi:hypothetical protein